MRRSRRSLSLLLGMMAVSLAVVRVTTQPAMEEGKNTTSVTARSRLREKSGRDSGLGPELSGILLHALPPDSGNHSQTSQTRATRAVSAIAVILVIPAPVEPAVPRIGWSGCEAYAVGCDHLGRPLTASKDEEIVAALTARRF